MDLPGLPTDNLYKFLAIGGIVLIGYSAWLSRNRKTIRDRLASRYFRLQRIIDKHGRSESMEAFSFLQTALILSRSLEFELEVGEKRRLSNLLQQQVYLLFGAFFTGFGFIKWYYKHQVFEDWKLQKELFSLSNEVDFAPVYAEASKVWLIFVLILVVLTLLSVIGYFACRLNKNPLIDSLQITIKHLETTLQDELDELDESEDNDTSPSTTEPKSSE